MQKTDQESENADNLSIPVESNTTEIAQQLLEAEATQPVEEQWNSATEEEWNEHSATSWALAHVIHRIRSTPHPPILLPEQRRHFEKVVEMAAALIEQWQGHERDLAQQLGMRRPITELSTEPIGASQNHLDGNEADEDWIKPAFTPLYQLLLEDDVEETLSVSPKAPGTPATEQDYQI
jgi:hypothetical protein